MELQLSLSLSNNNNSSNNKNYKMVMINKQETKKRCYRKAFDDNVLDDEEEEVNSSDVVPKTLSLFVWKPTGEYHSDNNHPRDHLHTSIQSNKNDEENGMMGWPPINRWRKKMCYYPMRNMFINNYEMGVENGGGNNVRRNVDGIYRGRNPKYLYVKVKMEGVGIGRKIDLSAHHSFQTLTHSLMLMFGKRHEKNAEFKLTYENEDGAWLLAGDQPWGNFVQTVRRLKLVKNGDKI